MDKNLQTIELPEMFVRALVDIKTFDPKTRTVEVTFATENPVLRHDWNVGKFFEVLSFDPAHVRFERFEQGGASVLNDHQKWGVENVLGVVIEAELEAKQGRAKLQLSNREDIKGIVDDIQAGIIRQVSIGYNVFKYEPVETSEEVETPTYRAVDWEPYEISFTPVSADFMSTVRKKDQKTHSVEILNTNPTRKMEKEEKPAGEEGKTKTPESGSGERSKGKGEEVKTESPKTDPPVDEKKIRSEAAIAERERSKEINTLVRKMQLPDGDAFAQKMIDEGKSIDEVRKLAIDKWAGDDPAEGVKGANAKVTVDQADKTRSLIETALEIRSYPGAKDNEGKVLALPEEAKQYRGIGLLDVAKEILEQKGVATRGLGAMELSERALSTSDYPLLLANVGNKTLRRAYAEAQQTWKPLATRMDAKDFKAMSMVAVGGSLNLEEVKEDGEFKQAKLAEAAESFQLATYGKILTLTRQAIINDDLNAFSRALTMFGRSASRKESDIVWALITGNPTMADDVALFHADHNNLLTASDLDEDGLTAATVAMARQVGIDGEPIGIMPAFLIVPPELLVTAEKIVSAVIAGTTDEVNVFANKMKVISDPRITDTTDWYITASPSQIDMIAYGYLNGSEGVYTETKYGFDVDGLQLKCRLDFGASLMDHRGFYKTPGE